MGFDQVRGRDPTMRTFYSVPRKVPESLDLDDDAGIRYYADKTISQHAERQQGISCTHFSFTQHESPDSPGTAEAALLTMMPGPGTGYIAGFGVTECPWRPRRSSWPRP
jgi:hypothetical protein